MLRSALSFISFAILALLFLPRAMAQDHAGSYALPFGNQPFAPSRATATFASFLKPADFPPASYCAKCHERIHQEWRESAHSNSFREPFYVKNVQLLIDQKGIEFSRHCEGCHNPVALFSGALTRNSAVDRSFDEDGITCSVCHSIAKIEQNAGTGSYVMGRPAVMLNPDGSPREGLPSPSEILEDVGRHKKAVMRDFLRTSEFCSVCHKAAIPRELTDYKWLRAFSVYDEWQQSSWSKQSPLPFYKKDSASGCQSCHMPLREAKGEYAAVAGKLPSHRFPGANSAIPTYYSYPDQLKITQDFLRDSVKVDIFGITIQHHGESSQVFPADSRSFRIAGGDVITLDVVIQNSRIGHSLVPEQRDFYESWVECTVLDAQGADLFHSGALDKDGSLDPSAHSYTNRLIDKSGSRIVQHQVWQTRLKTYDNTIPPGRSDLVRYRFRIPASQKGRIELAVKVNYRRFRKQYSDFILGGSNLYPVLELGVARLPLKMGKNQTPAGAVDLQKRLLRWNNYGISLLGQQQWWAAADAFAETTKIDPAYADGYINRAIAEYSKWIEARKENPDGPGILALDNANAPAESFSYALKLLEKALEIAPRSARALFYQGLILRLQNRLPEAATALNEVTRQYPRLRQGHQELAYVYYLQGAFAKAVAEFEAVKSINPDDITACYYLSIAYQRVGESAKASENALLYATHRDDPNNFGLNLEFVQKNPIEANELTPYHIHSR
jgi:tetratricopeptide (TPR) repeat protein